jgi:hypothetical protein
VRAGLVQNWTRIGSGKVHLTNVSVSARNPLPQDYVTQLQAAEAVTLKLKVEGTSESACWRLPQEAVGMAVARQGVKWYVVPYPGFDTSMYFFQCS